MGRDGLFQVPYDVLYVEIAFLYKGTLSVYKDNIGI